MRLFTVPVIPHHEQKESRAVNVSLEVYRRWHGRFASWPCEVGIQLAPPQCLRWGECRVSSRVSPGTHPEKWLYTFAQPIYGTGTSRLYPLIPLTDGGVYDNSGLEAIIKPVKIPGYDELIEPAEFLIVSDGGAPVTVAFRRFRNTSLRRCCPPLPGRCYCSPASERVAYTLSDDRIYSRYYVRHPDWACQLGGQHAHRNVYEVLRDSHENHRIPDEILAPLRKIRTSSKRH